jgi:8-oxo-dGTP pyrophosphatase MutT (NUDIX family)
MLKAGTETGYGAGVLFFCPATDNFLFIRRAQGDTIGTWCAPGGGVEDYETIDEAVRRECQEEIGYRPTEYLIHMNRTKVSDNFIFHNHFAIVDKEFVPKLNPEHDAYVWAPEIPSPAHPGMAAAIEQWAGRQGIDI